MHSFTNSLYATTIDKWQDTLHQEDTCTFPFISINSETRANISAIPSPGLQLQLLQLHTCTTVELVVIKKQIQSVTF